MFMSEIKEAARVAVYAKETCNALGLESAGVDRRVAAVDAAIAALRERDARIAQRNAEAKAEAEARKAYEAACLRARDRHNAAVDALFVGPDGRRRLWDEVYADAKSACESAIKRRKVPQRERRIFRDWWITRYFLSDPELVYMTPKGVMGWRQFRAYKLS